MMAGGAVVTAVAVRDGLRFSDRISRDLGVVGWAVFALVALGAVAQALALFGILRRGAGRWRNLRQAFVWFVAAACAHMVLVRKGTGLSVELFLALWAGATAWSIWRAPRRDGLPTSRWSLVAFQLCFTLVLLEVALRILGTLAPNPVLVPSDSSVLARIEAHSIRPGFVHLGFPHNSAGFYDDEFLARENRSRPAVAVIGDSFSLSVVPHRAHYTTVCERELGDVDVYNVGVGACGPEEYRELLVADVLPLDPDAVIVAVFVGNDLKDLRTHASSKRLRSLFDRGSSRLVMVASRIFRIARERQRGGADWAQRSGKLLPSEDALRDAYPWYADPLRDQPNMSEAAYMKMVRSRIPVSCTPDPQRIRNLIDVLQSMRALAERPFGVLLIPAEFQVEDGLWQEALEGLPAADYVRDEPQRWIARELEAAGIPYVDVLSAMRAQPAFEDGDRHLYRPRDTHWGVLGNRIGGQQLVPLVRRLLE